MAHDDYEAVLNMKEMKYAKRPEQKFPGAARGGKFDLINDVPIRKKTVDATFDSDHADLSF